MKLLVLFLFVILTFSWLRAQKGFQFIAAEKYGVRISDLDSTYQSAVNADSTKAVFKNTQQVAEAYYSLLQDLGDYLDKNGFQWEQTTRGFNRIYFNKNGKIDYFAYQFKGDLLTEEKLALFDKLLNQFIQDYQFPLSADIKFAQCSPVTYTPKSKE